MSFLEIHAVSKAFGGIQMLDACSLAVEQGTITGLIGPNGSGKTTLFNVITGYEAIDSGEIRFDGRVITGEKPDQVFGLGIGRTFQLTRVFQRLTVLENMHVAIPRKGIRGLLKYWGPSQEQRQALDLLDLVGLITLKNEPAGNLSYGQKKLLEFALILVAQPQVILSIRYSATWLDVWPETVFRSSRVYPYPSLKTNSRRYLRQQQLQVP